MCYWSAEATALWVMQIDTFVNCCYYC